MKNEKAIVNELVVNLRGGNELSFNEIFTIMYAHIEVVSRIVAKKHDDATKFEARVLARMDKALADPRVNDFHGYVKAIINNEKADFVNRRKRQREDISMSAFESDNEDDTGFQFVSKTDVEAEVLYQERVTLLAQGNPKKEVILLNWTVGATDSAISEMLAHQFGGKAESHRKFIQRFRNDCRLALEVEMVA